MSPLPLSGLQIGVLSPVNLTEFMHKGTHRKNTMTFYASLSLARASRRLPDPLVLSMRGIERLGVLVLLEAPNCFLAKR